MITRYVDRALARAQYRLIEDGTFGATVRGLRGVIATGCMKMLLLAADVVAVASLGIARTGGGHAPKRT